MNTIQQLKDASARAQEIIAEFTAKNVGAPDVVAARTEELMKLKKEELVVMVLALEKPRNEKPFKVEDVARKLLEEPLCSIFTYEQIASLIHQAIPDGKTSSKSIASYASKHKEDWAIVARQKFQLDPTQLLAVNG